MSRPQPYVGVSGLTHPSQTAAILDMWPRGAPAQSLMIGALESQKTLIDGGECNARSPEPALIHEIFPDDPRALNLVHYFSRTTNESELAFELSVADLHGGLRCDGLQIDAAWPPREALRFRRHGPPSRAVLQIGHKMLYESGWVLEVVCELVADREYRGVITDVLIDASGGRGPPIDVDFVGRAVDCMRSWNPDLGIGIAGGLCAETLPAVADLVRECGLSVDAEGGLRDGDDNLDLGKVEAYLRVAADIWGYGS